MQPTRHIQRFPWGTADDAQVLIVHFGSKSTSMIAQLLRHIGLRSRVIDAADVPAVTASGYHPRLVILSGGDDSVFNENAPTMADRELAVFMQHGVVLGICYGAQVLAVKFGGKVATAAIPEFGEVQVQVTEPFGTYAGGTAVMNHNDEIVTLPPGWDVFASTAHCQHALVGTGGIYAVIRHPSYLGLLLLSLGWGLAFRSWIGVILTLLTIPPILARIRAEEALLRAHFGAEYEAYRTRTARLIPGLY